MGIIIDFGGSIKIRCDKAPPRPARVTLAEKVELDMDRFGFTFALPPSDPDTASRELSITVNGGDPPTVKTYQPTAAVTDQLIFNQDDQLVLTLVDIDDAGNRSQASAALSVTVNDDVPPATPGALGVASKVELPDESPPAP